MMIKLCGISKSFGKEELKVDVLTELDLSIKKGEMLAIMGKSGSGHVIFAKYPGRNNTGRYW